MEQPEELEHIPWSALEDATDNRNRIFYITAAAIAAVAIAVVVARSAVSGDTTVAAPASTEPTAEASTTTVATTATTATTAPLYTEADLMAALGEAQERVVASKAEWFVTDYFTRDGDPNGVGFIDAALPDGALRPELPHEQEGPVTYVEWARAVHVTELMPGRYRVRVAFRSVAQIAELGGDFARLPVRAVDVLLELSADGGASVLDLPSPARVPEGVPVSPWPEPTETPPLQLHAQLGGGVAYWGDQPAVTGGTRLDDGGWRVEFTMWDEADVMWPLVAYLDPEGFVVPPGYLESPPG